MDNGGGGGGNTVTSPRIDTARFTVTKFKLHLETLDARIVPDATPTTTIPPPAQAPPPFNPKEILASLWEQFDVASARVKASVTKVTNQLDVVVQTLKDSLAAHNALLAAELADQPALAVKYDAALVKERAANELFADLVGQYRLDWTEMVRLEKLIHQFDPTANVNYPAPLAPAINRLVLGCGDPETL